MGGLGELVLRGMRNSAIALAILTEGCGTFRSDYAPLRDYHSRDDVRATIHYVFSPANEVGKLYLAVIKMWKEAFGDNVRIVPYCTPMPDNGVSDEVYCERDSGRARDALMAILGEDVRVPAVVIEYDDGRSVEVSSDEELCTSLDYPPNCLDSIRETLYSSPELRMRGLSGSRHLESHSLRY
jgi:hypothetical protein